MGCDPPHEFHPICLQRCTTICIIVVYQSTPPFFLEGKNKSYERNLVLQKHFNFLFLAYVSTSFWWHKPLRFCHDRTEGLSFSFHFFLKCLPPLSQSHSLLYLIPIATLSLRYDASIVVSRFPRLVQC
jgi:hypothetical protein